MEFHNYPLKERKFEILADIFLHDYELEIPYHIAAGQTFIATNDIYFLICNEVFHNFSEHEVDSRFNSETKSEINADYIVRDDMLYLIFRGVWIIQCINMHQSVNISSLRVFI